MTAILCVVAGFWPKVEKYWPVGASRVRLIAKNPETWVLLFVLVMLFISFTSLQKKIGKAKLTPSGSMVALENKENTASNALEIRFEEREPYSEVESFANGMVRRIFWLRVYNIGNGFLTDTKVFIKATVPSGPDGMIKVMAPSEALPLNQFRTVKLADYVEIASDISKVVDKITLGWTYGGGFLDGDIPAFDAVNSNAPLVVTVEATARQCTPYKATFRIWVDGGTRKLRAERF